MMELMTRELYKKIFGKARIVNKRWTRFLLVTSRLVFRLLVTSVCYFSSVVNINPSRIVFQSIRTVFHRVSMVVSTTVIIVLEDQRGAGLCE
jgi:hypothetical protein